MFKCQLCGLSSRTFHSLVTKKRKVKYSTTIIYPNNSQKNTHGNGWEIVNELKLCSNCYEKHKNDPVKIINSDPIHRKQTEKKKK